jgi:hypothetical protein
MVSQVPEAIILKAVSIIAVKVPLFTPVIKTEEYKSPLALLQYTPLSLVDNTCITY